jgi:regulator of replication initiation timing
MKKFENTTNETIDLVNKLSSNLKSMIDEQNKMINLLPENMRSKLSTQQSEINKIMEHIKNGDVEALNQLQQKYANSNIK